MSAALFASFKYSSLDPSLFVIYMKKMMLLPFLKYLEIVTMALNPIVLVFLRAVFFFAT